MAPADNLSPAGSSTYQSNTMYVGDGTWDATKNTFLLPNLVGLNFATMRYNGMGNRFGNDGNYKSLVEAHAILAVITFLFVVPAAIMLVRFYHRPDSRRGIRWHIYLQILTVLLTTVLFTLGWFAVGTERSLTNPHHGIGLAIYVLVLVQFLGGWWVHRKAKKRVLRRLPLKNVLHQWFGRAIALLGIVQVPLGLTLYGSPEWTFILYALWAFFLLCLYFYLSLRAQRALYELLQDGGTGRIGRTDGTVLSERTRSRSRFGWLAPLAAGAGAAALLSKKREKSRTRTEEVIPSRRGSRRGSQVYVEEKRESTRKEGGVINRLFTGAAALGAGAVVASLFKGKKDKNVRNEDEYSSVAQDTPGRRRRPRQDSLSTDSFEESRVSHVVDQNRRGPILPGPGDPVAAAAAMSAAEARPRTPRTPTRPVRSHGRQESFDSGSYTYDSGTLSPSRRPQEPSHKVRNGLLAGVGIAWLTKMMRNRKDKKEQDRLDQLEEDRIDEERRRRRRSTSRGPRFTADGTPPGRRGPRREPSLTESSVLSSILDPYPRVGQSSIEPSRGPARLERSRATDSILLPAAAIGATAGLARARSLSRPRQDMGVGSTMARPSESDSEIMVSRPSRRPSQRRRDGDAAAAVAAAAGLAAEDEARKRHARSRSRGVASPPVSVKVKVHGDKDRNVTLRRLTDEEAAAERAGRRSRRDSISTMSGADTGPSASRRRYRREERLATAGAVESEIDEAGNVTDVILPPPNPLFAEGKIPRDLAYHSGRPEASGVGTGVTGVTGSHGTWSEMSPDEGMSQSAAEKRRRRRAERQRLGGASTVDYT